MATDPTTQKTVDADNGNADNGDSLEAGTEKFGEGALNNDIRPGSAEHVVATENTTQQTNLGGSTAIDLEVEKFRSSEGKTPKKESDDG